MGLTNPGQQISTEEHARRVREMFARISKRYDLLNHLLSGNIDKRWRRAVTEKLRPLIPANADVLDVACGTGGLTAALLEHTGMTAMGVDFWRSILELAVPT